MTPQASQIFSFSLCFLLIMSLPACAARPSSSAVSSKIKSSKDYKEYIAFFEKIYTMMDEQYYESVHREDFDRFINAFDANIYAQLQKEKKSDDFIRWRSAAYLVDFLKSKEDVFSALYPPKPAEEYSKDALGERIDLGIDGEKIDVGFHVKHVEPRSDAYALGLREDDLITAINGESVSSLSAEDIESKLTPLKDAKVKIIYIDQEKKQPREIEPQSKEYFKQTVFLKDMPIPGIFCLEIPKFNRMTSEDLLRFLTFIKEHDAKGLILDLRGNPGGPPLAAREISSFFLKAGELFAYFQKKGQDKAELDVPVIPEEYKFDGPMVILVDKQSGSSSELFAGVLQSKGRAVLMGENTAGQVMLKSMLDLGDKSMLLLITSRGHYPDGRTFSFSGLDPDNKVEPDAQSNLIKIAAIYLYKVSTGEIKL